MTYAPGNKTFTAYIASGQLPMNRIVKMKSGTTTDPPQVELCGAGEFGIGVTLNGAISGDPITVKPWQSSGTFSIECTVGAAIARGTALYVAALGKASDTSSGNTIGSSLQVGATGQYIEVIPVGGLSTTAGSISVADSGSLITGTTVEAALAEAFTHIKSAQAIIPIPLGCLVLEDGTAIGKFSDGASATPGFNQVSAKELVLRWNNNGTVTKVAAFGIPLPPDLDATKDMVVHWRAKMSGATDTPDLEHEVYLGAGDTDCAGTDDEIDGAATLTEYTATVLAADIGGSPEEMTLIFSPKAGEVGTDDTLVYSVWVEYTRKTLTA